MAAQPRREGPLPAGSLLELGRALLRASRAFPSRLLEDEAPDELLRCGRAGSPWGRGRAVHRQALRCRLTTQT